MPKIIFPSFTLSCPHSRLSLNQLVLSVQQLAAHAKIFVNDAFGAAHRAHASTVGVTKFMDHSVAGFLMEKELDYLKGAMDSPTRPFLAMIGGAKVSTKVCFYCEGLICNYLVALK